MFMANPNNMIRTDGTKVSPPRHPSRKTEIYGLWVALRNDPLIILLFPLFFASNWFYTWRKCCATSIRTGVKLTLYMTELNDYNGALFSIRARSLNDLVYWMAQMVASPLIGLLLDAPGLNRRMRAFVGWSVLFLMVFVVHIWAYFYQR